MAGHGQHAAAGSGLEAPADTTASVHHGQLDKVAM